MPLFCFTVACSRHFEQLVEDRQQTAIRATIQWTAESEADLQTAHNLLQKAEPANYSGSVGRLTWRKTMTRAETFAEIQSWNFNDRLELFHEMWDSITTDAGVLPLSPEVRQLLEERLAEDDANPDDVITWEEIESSLKAQP